MSGVWFLFPRTRMPRRNFSLCESAKLISPDKRCCPKGLGKIPVGMFSGFQISSPSSWTRRHWPSETPWWVDTRPPSQIGLLLVHLSPHVMKTLDVSQRMHNHELNADTAHIYSFSRPKQLCNSGNGKVFLTLPQSSGLWATPSSRGEKIILYLEGVGQSWGWDIQEEWVLI